MKTPLLELAEVSQADTTGADEINDAFWRLDAIVQLSVLSRSTQTPPTDAVQGDRYIVPVDATAEWYNRTLQIAYRSPNGWVFIAPRNGWVAFVVDEDSECRFNDTDGDPQWIEMLVDGGEGEGDPTIQIDVLDDFEAGLASNANNEYPWSTANTGSAAGLIASINTVADHPGVIVQETGSTSTGYTYAIRKRAGTTEDAWCPILLSATHAHRIEALVKVETLPSVAQNFHAQWGAGTRIASRTTIAQYVLACVTHDGSNVVWRLECKNMSGTTSADATGPAADTWYHLRIEITTLAATLYVNGVQVCQVAANLPTVPLALLFGPQKSAGTTSRTQHTDMMRWRHTFSAARYTEPV